MTDEISIGIAGLGHRGRLWAERLQRVGGYRIVALCDPIEALHEAARAAVTDATDLRSYVDYDELLADARVDAVAMCVRSRDQGEMAARALDAGKHVTADVPAAHRLEDCWRIVLAAERTGHLYHLAEHGRYWGFIEHWTEIVADGRLGRVTYGEGQYIGFYGTDQFFQDPETGRFFSADEVAEHPEARPTWLQEMPPIHYLPHELSPLLKVLDDRIIDVVGMGTSPPSDAHPQILRPDIQVALMKTEKDAVLRVAAGFAHPIPQRDRHWYQLMGTEGCLEWRRSQDAPARVWLADSGHDEWQDTDWGFERRGLPGEVEADLQAHAEFRDALLHGRPRDLEMYAAMDTAAPAILAADSIATGGQPQSAPDFRPGPERELGEEPSPPTQREG